MPTTYIPSPFDDAFKSFQQVSGLANQKISNQYMQAQMKKQEQDALAEQQQKAAERRGAISDIDTSLPLFESDPVLKQAISPFNQKAIETYRGSQSEHQRMLGDARTPREMLQRSESQLGSQAVSLQMELDAAKDRAFQAQGFEASKAAVMHLPEAERDHQLKLIDAAIAVIASGTNAGDAAQILRNLNPNIGELASMHQSQKAAERAGNDMEADKIATPAFMQALVKLGHIDQATAAAMGETVFFGAAGQLAELLNNQANSALFAGNAAVSHQNAMTEIGARGANDVRLNGIRWEETFLEAYNGMMNFGALTPGKSGTSGQMPSQAPASPDHALQMVQERFAPMFRDNPAELQRIMANLQNKDSQVLADYAFYSQKNISPEQVAATYTIVPNPIADNERSAEQMRELLRMLSERRRGAAALRGGESSLEGATNPFGARGR